MDSNTLIAAARRLHLLQGLYITFHNNTSSVEGVAMLIAIRQRVVGVKMENASQMLLQAVVRSGRWENVSRTVMIYGAGRISDTMLAALANYIESIHVGEHFAKALFTSSVHKKLEAKTTIIGAVLDGPFLREVADWGLSINADFSPDEILPGVRFSIMNDQNRPVGYVDVDGFTGRMRIDGEADWRDTCCSTAEPIQKLLMERLTTYVETSTAAPA